MACSPVCQCQKDIMDSQYDFMNVAETSLKLNIFRIYLSSIFLPFQSSTDITAEIYKTEAIIFNAHV